ncbi:glycosyltransferase family 2 protein [Pantoea agglomerans]
MSNHTKRISIIIPAYNAGSYITNTLDSIYNSITHSFEIIIVDDKSKDSTLEVISEYSKNKDNIKVIEKNTNEGPGVARDLGLKYAQGDYTLFFDSDDLMHECSVDKIINFMDVHNLDVSIAKYNILYGAEKENIAMWDKDREIYDYIHKNIGNIIDPKIYPKLLTLINYPWTKICKTQYLIKNKVSFGSLRLHEDILPHWTILMNSNKVHVSEEIICDYILDPTGNNMTNNSSKLRIQCLDAIHQVHCLIKNNHKYKDFEFVFWSFSADVIGWAYGIISEEFKKSFHKTAKEFFLNMSFEQLQNIYHSNEYFHNSVCKFIINKEGI